MRNLFLALMVFALTLMLPSGTSAKDDVPSVNTLVTVLTVRGSPVVQPLINKIGSERSLVSAYSAAFTPAKFRFALTNNVTAAALMSSTPVLQRTATPAINSNNHNVSLEVNRTGDSIPDRTNDSAYIHPFT